MGGAGGGEVEPFSFFCAASFHLLAAPAQNESPTGRKNRRHSESSKRTCVCVRDLYAGQRTSIQEGRRCRALTKRNSWQLQGGGNCRLRSQNKGRASLSSSVCLHVSSPFKLLLQLARHTAMPSMRLISFRIAREPRNYRRTKGSFCGGAGFCKVAYNATVRGCNLCDRGVKSDRPPRRK